MDAVSASVYVTGIHWSTFYACCSLMFSQNSAAEWVWKIVGKTYKQTKPKTFLMEVNEKPLPNISQSWESVVILQYMLNATCHCGIAFFSNSWPRWTTWSKNFQQKNNNENVGQDLKAVDRCYPSRLSEIKLSYKEVCKEIMQSCGWQVSKRGFDSVVSFQTHSTCFSCFFERHGESLCWFTKIVDNFLIKLKICFLGWKFFLLSLLLLITRIIRVSSLLCTECSMCFMINVRTISN